MKKLQLNDHDRNVRAALQRTRVREEAILICDIAASSLAPYAQWYLLIGHDLDATEDAVRAAVAAGSTATRWTEFSWPGCPRTREGHATAAALLRDGWRPGDPVRRLR